MILACVKFQQPKSNPGDLVIILVLCIQAFITDTFYGMQKEKKYK